jgi:undecaprenyl-diphosphatase
MKHEGNNRKSINQRILIAVAVSALICFLVIAIARPCFDQLNTAVNLWATGIQTEGLTQAAKALDFFDTKIFLVITLPLAGVLLWKGYTEKAALLAGAMGIDALLLEASKTLIASPRPLNSLMVDVDNSFPSGHVTSIIVFGGMLTYLAWENRKTVSKLCTAAIGPLTAIVAFDRLYLNAHWLSDVLAAPFIALFIIAATLLIVPQLVHWVKREQTPSQPIRSGAAKSALHPKKRTLYGRAITRKPQTNTAVTTDA